MVSCIRQPPTAMVLDFRGLMQAPEAFSNCWSASSIMMKSVTTDIKMVTSSAYYTTAVVRALRPILTPGSFFPRTSVVGADKEYTQTYSSDILAELRSLWELAHRSVR
jgi:hypothetical protein